MEEHTNQLADLINPGGMRMKDGEDKDQKRICTRDLYEDKSLKDQEGRDNTTQLGDDQEDHALLTSGDDQQHDQQLDKEDQMEDDWKETSSDLEDFLRMSQRYYDQEDSNPPCKDPLLSSKTKTTSQEDGQDDLVGVREALGSLYPSSTTTPCKGNGAVDPEGSTIFYDRWDELSEAGKDRAFELWTSPVVMRTPGVIRILEEERMIGGYANNEGRSQEDDLEKKELRSPEPPVGSLDKHTTGKPIPVIDNDILFVAKLDQEGLKEGGVDVTTTTPPIQEMKSTLSSLDQQNPLRQ